jgi:hypothetical protein
MQINRTSTPMQTGSSIGKESPDKRISTESVKPSAEKPATIQPPASPTPQASSEAASQPSHVQDPLTKSLAQLRLNQASARIEVNVGEVTLTPWVNSPTGNPAAPVNVSPDVSTHDVDPVGKPADSTAGKTDGAGNTGVSLIGKALETLDKLRKTDPALLTKLGVDVNFVNQVFDLLEGWKAKGGEDVIVPRDGVQSGPSSNTSPQTGAGNATENSTSSDSNLGLNDRPDHSTQKENDSSGTPATSSTSESSDGVRMGTNEPANAMPGTAWSPDGTKVRVKDWDGSTREFATKEEYDAWVAQNNSKETAASDKSNGTETSSETEKASESDKSSESEKASESDKSTESTETDDSDSSTEYVDNDPSGYSYTIASAEQMEFNVTMRDVRSGGDPVNPDLDINSQSTINEPVADAGTNPNVDPDQVYSSPATITRAPAPADPYPNPNGDPDPQSGPPADPNDPRLYS